MSKPRIPRFLTMVLAPMILFALIAASCPNGNGGGGGDFSLTLNPSSITITPDGQMAVDVNVNPTGGFQGDVDLTVAGSLPGISFTLDDTTVSAGGNTTLQVDAQMAAERQGATIEVEGSAASGSQMDTATLTINVQAATQTIDGRVLDTNGAPVRQVPVLIGQQQGTTDQNGEFSISGVTIPYDAAVVVTGQNSAVVYQGLTKQDPTLIFVGSSPVSSNSATITGTVTAQAPPAAYPEAASETSSVAFGSPQTTASTTVNPNTGAYAVTPVWFDPATINGDLHALQWDTDAAGLPTDFLNYGMLSNVPLADGSGASNQNIQIASIAPATVSGSVTVPPNFSFSGNSMSAVFNGEAVIPVLFDPVNTTFSYTTPSVPGAEVRLVASATRSTSNKTLTTIAVENGVAVDASGVTLDLIDPPNHSTPGSGASGIDLNTSFTWTNFTGGVHVVGFRPSAAGDPTIFVVTGNTETTIPDPSELGLGTLPSGANYDWEIFGVAPFTDVDDAATERFVDVSTFSAPTATSQVGLSGALSFTTQQ